MTDLDQALRRITDLEAVVREQGYRIKALESTLRPVALFPYGIDEPGGRVAKFSTNMQGGKQWCECGRDVCRAPDCPSHKG